VQLPVPASALSPSRPNKPSAQIAERMPGLVQSAGAAKARILHTKGRQQSASPLLDRQLVWRGYCSPASPNHFSDNSKNFNSCLDWAAKSLFRPLATGSRKRSRGVEVGEEKTKLFIFLFFLHMGPSYFCYCCSTSTQEPPVVI
jgi:hypothetical protein